MTITTKDLKSTFGKKIGIVAERGDLRAEGKTTAEAKAKLDTQIDWACDAAGASMVESRFGLLLILHGTPNGYQWRVIDPADLAHGKEFYSVCCTGQIAYSVALNEMRMAAAQRAWSAFAQDEKLIEMAQILPASQESLRRWIAFQRENLAA